MTTITVLVYLAGVGGMLSLCSYLYVARKWYKQLYSSKMDITHVWFTAVLWPLGIFIVAGRLISELTIARANRLAEQKQLAQIELDRAMREVEQLMRTPSAP